MKIRDDIADRIIALRKSKNLSQRELSKILGVSCTSIGDIERRKKGVSLRILKRLSESFDIPPTYFFGDSDRPEDDEFLYRSIPSSIITALKLYADELSPEAHAEVIMFIVLIVEREKARKKKREGG